MTGTGMTGTGMTGPEYTGKHRRGSRPGAAAPPGWGSIAVARDSGAEPDGGLTRDGRLTPGSWPLPGPPGDAGHRLEPGPRADAG
jgi:hypothetical protein